MRLLEKGGILEWVLLNRSEAKAGPSDRAVIWYDDMGGFVYLKKGEVYLVQLLRAERSLPHQAHPRWNGLEGPGSAVWLPGMGSTRRPRIYRMTSKVLSISHLIWSSRPHCEVVITPLFAGEDPKAANSEQPAQAHAARKCQNGDWNLGLLTSRAPGSK